jgi:hypothetical protein
MRGEPIQEAQSRSMGGAGPWSAQDAWLGSMVGEHSAPKLMQGAVLLDRSLNWIAGQSEEIYRRHAGLHLIDHSR